MRIHELDRHGGYLGRAIAAIRAHEAARKGLHASTIIDGMLRAINPRQYSIEFSDDQKFGYQEIGNVVEDFLADWLRHRVAGWHKPAPRVHRGITGSPDGWSPRSRAIHEIKACWKSEKLFDAVMQHRTSRRVDPIDLVRENLKLFAYVIQVLTYAEMWDAERGYLHILFINGNYKPPAPRSRTFTLAFTKRERRENFDRLAQFAIDQQWLTEKEAAA